jgi:hypothetical protein
MSYSCKDPSCTEDEGWHLLHADPDCVEENQAVLEDWVNQARASLAGTPTKPYVVTLHIAVVGYQDTQTQVTLEPMPLEVATPPSESMPGMDM